MAALICDICGGQLSMDASGDFAVCESCGMKHTKDRVKAKVQEITGTVKIDDTDAVQEQIGNWETMASTAYGNSNYEEAYTYYCKILEKKVDYWFATFRKGMCLGWQSNLANIRVSEVLGGIVDATKLLLTDEEQTDKLKADGKLAMTVELFNWIQAVSNLIVNHANEFAGEVVSAAREFYERECLISELIKFNLNMMDETAYEHYEDKEGLTNLINTIISLGNTTVSNMNASFSIKTGSKYNSFWQIYEDVIENVSPDYKTITARNELSAAINKAKSNLQTWKSNFEKKQAEKARKEKEERIEKYWAEHAEEKAQLEARLSEIEDELKPLKENASRLDIQYNNISKKKNNPVPIDAEIRVLSEKRSALLKERESLGLFAGKRKKAIMEEVQALDSERARLDVIAKNQRNELIASVNEELAPIEKELTPLKKQIQDLDREKQSIKSKLTMDR
ncbi:MAG: hypothetical protein IKY18_05755 [Oscillospiraceae bacterium]|nr:hypothetical protein [Oscillospiraceae bacterium]